MADKTKQGDPLAQLLDFLRGLSLRQKLMLVGGAVVVAATLLLFVRYAGEPEYKAVYSGMKSEEAQSVAAALVAKNISAKVSPDGTAVSVPAEQLDNARLAVASAGPRSGRMGFELFDKMNWASSDFDEKVNYQRALEGELERTIQTLSGVESVRVHLVMPSESVFSEREHKAKASVALRMRGPGLNEGSQVAVARLVASSVERLDPEDVTIVDAQTNRRLGGVQAGAAAAEDAITKKLMATLEPIAGADRIRASVQVEVDPSTHEESEEKYDPNSAVALSMQRTEERNGQASAAGIPGTASNLPGSSPAGPRGAEDSQASKSESGTYAVNRVFRHTTRPAGGIRRITAAVLVDDVVESSPDAQKQVRRKRSADEIKQIEDLARAAIGLDSARGDVLSVQNISFATSPVSAPMPPGKIERVRKVANDWSVVLRYGVMALVFGVVYLLVLRPVKKQALTAFRQMPKAMAAAPSGNTIEAVAAGTLAADTPEARRTIALKKQVAEKVMAQPGPASRLLQSWIGGGGS